VSFGDSGTCYLAEEELGSFIEVFRDTIPIAPAAVAERGTSVCTFAKDLLLADCTSRTSRAFGITAELHSGRGYSRSQAWAVALALAGFDGMRYFVSHDPAQDLIGAALFGAVGHVPGTARMRGIGPGVLEVARRQFGVRVLPTA
jgi:RES domain